MLCDIFSISTAMNRYNTTMRASVQRKRSLEQQQAASQHIDHWRLLKLIVGLVTACVLFLLISSWYQSYSAESQKRAQDKEFAAIDVRVTATLQKRVDDAKKAEAAAKASASTDQAIRSNADAASPSGTPSSGRCDVTDPVLIVVVVNKKHCISPSSWEPDDLVEVGEFSLRKDAAEAYERMHTAAPQAGYSFEPSSAYRSYATQVATYNTWVQVNGSQAAADTVSARPGYSEHQTGLAIDLRTNTRCALECFGSTGAYAWMTQHAADYGFIERYPPGLTSITGYSPEAWHWRYVGTKTAKDMKSKGIQTLEMYRAISGGDYA